MTGQQPYRQRGGPAQQPYRRPQQGGGQPFEQPFQQPSSQPSQQQSQPSHQQPQQQRVARQGQARPAQPRTDGQPRDAYGVAPALVQNASLGQEGRPRSSGAVVALGVFLLALAVVVPVLLLVLTSNTSAGFQVDPVWSFAVPAGTAVLTIALAARAIANAGGRGRPLRALVHVVLGCAVLVLAVSLTTDATGVPFFSF